MNKRIKHRIGSLEEYEVLYKESIADPETFWAREAQENLEWMKPWTKVMEYDFSSIGKTTDPYVTFFKDAELNVSVNCLDRHLATKKDHPAIIWQGEEGSNKKVLTYGELQEQVCRFANVLKKHGVKKGSVVTIFLPMIPEAAIAMLACARIGAIHCVVFSAFSSVSLRSRIEDCKSNLVITASNYYHSGKTVPLKSIVDEALQELSQVHTVIVVKRNEEPVVMKNERDIFWHEEIQDVAISSECAPEPMNSEDPLFILYTSGSTGKPKAVLHTTAGYLLYTHTTFKYIFDPSPEDIHFCTADVGWITGHSYVVYSPLSNGITTLMYEGTPTYPKPDRLWEIIDEYAVTSFYTAPTAIRALMRLGDTWPSGHDLSSLRILGSVGEPINVKAWQWYHEQIGKGRCPIVDTWWQTETGGIAISPLPVFPMQPGSAGRPFFGISCAVLAVDGIEVPPGEEGTLVITKPWPGMIRGIYGDTQGENLKKNYFSVFPEKFYTGDGCRIDEQGNYWLLGRIDDVMNVSAHRFSTAEIESCLVSHPAVTEAAVVGIPDEIKGQAIYCFVTLGLGHEHTSSIAQELFMHVRKTIGPIATPKHIQFVTSLPKTRSGKIMRRLLKKIVTNQKEELGDTSTLADPTVLPKVIEGLTSAFSFERS
jgi:acetyl-CoA synthetase